MLILCPLNVTAQEDVDCENIQEITKSIEIAYRLPFYWLQFCKTKYFTDHNLISSALDNFKGRNNGIYITAFNKAVNFSRSCSGINLILQRQKALSSGELENFLSKSFDSFIALSVANGVEGQNACTALVDSVEKKGDLIY